MQSRGLTRSGFYRWRPTNFGGPLQLIWRTQPTGSKTPGGAGTHTRHTGAHGHTDHAQTTVSGVPRLPQGSSSAEPVPRYQSINFRRHFLPSGVPRSGVLMMMCFSASRLCAVCPTIRPLTALRTCVRALRRGGAHRHARTPRGARTHSHNGTHKSSPHYMRACVRHTHPLAIKLHPLWSKTAMEGPRRTSSKPRRAIAGVAARSPCGARLTLRWHAKKVTASARSPWRSPHSSIASANEDCCRPCNRAPLSPDSNLRASSYVVIASMYLLSP